MYDDDWAQAQQADESARMRRADEILQAAKKRALQPEEVEFIAIEAGLGEIWRKHEAD